MIEHLNPQQPIDEPWKNGFGYTADASLTIPEEWPSGVYFVNRPQGLLNYRGGNQIPFIVKRASKQSDVVLLLGTNTANAYNEKGGESLYTLSAKGSQDNTVSFQRPKNIHFRTAPLLGWMTQQNYDYRVIADSDMDDYTELSGSRLLIVAGHNEFWTPQARENFDRFVEEGGSVLILGGNLMYKEVSYPDDQSLRFANDFYSPQSILDSIGLNYYWGGRGHMCPACDVSLGFDGYKIVDTSAPYFDHLDVTRGDILRMPFTSEYDGFPNLGLDADDATGFPIVDPKYSSQFYYFDLIGFEFAQLFKQRLPSRTLGGWIEFQHTPASGRVINVGTVIGEITASLAKMQTH